MPRGVRGRLSVGDRCPSYALDPHAPVVRAVRAACRGVFGRDPVLLPSGGSIPFVSTLAAARGIDVALFGFGLPDDGTHAPNERLYLPNLFRGTQACIELPATRQQRISLVPAGPGACCAGTGAADPATRGPGLVSAEHGVQSRDSLGGRTDVEHDCSSGPLHCPGSPRAAPGLHCYQSPQLIFGAGVEEHAQTVRGFGAFGHRPGHELMPVASVWCNEPASTAAAFRAVCWAKGPGRRGISRSSGNTELPSFPEGWQTGR